MPIGLKHRISGLLALVLLLAGSCRKAVPTPFTLKNNTGIDFRNDLNETDSFNIIEYLYYYNGAGVAAGDVNNDGLPDLFFTGNETSNQLYLNQGGFKFRNISAEAGVKTDGEWSTGVSMADVNGDGLLDIYVCQLGGGYKGKNGRNKLYINNGATSAGVTFTEQAHRYGLDFSGFGTQAAFFDFDRDGDLDVYLLNHSVHSVENYGNAEIRTVRDSLAGDRLMRNDNGHFTDVSQAAGIYGSRIGFGLGIGIADLNADGWPDIYISNDFHENDYLYLNNGDGTFTESLEKTIGHTSQFSMGNALADYNNDGLPDIVTMDMKPEDEIISKSSVGAEPYNIYQLKRRFGYYHQFPRNMLQLNQGIGSENKPAFSEIGELAGIDATDWSWSPLLEDLDNDGWKDLFITNGIWRRPNDLDYLRYSSDRQIRNAATDLEMAAKMPEGKMTNYAFRNKGDMTFENVSAAWGFDLPGVSNGAVFADLDNDGDKDLVINNLNAPASVYENRATGENGFLKIRLEGLPPNTFGIGAKVEITTGDNHAFQELFTARGFMSSTEPVMVFGIGTAPEIDRLKVTWPTGKTSLLEHVQPNQVLTVRESESVVLPGEKGSRTAEAAMPGSALGLGFVHQENKFDDFEYEKLMPHLLSTQGPRMAIADVNGDGWDDLYICGAAGQPGALYVQTGGGGFGQAPVSFAENAQSEETAAVFFDADGDGDQDLYVVCGGVEFPRQSPLFQDRLYLNDGAGNLQYAPAALPVIHNNGACAVPLDFNGDGATDLFVGTRSIPGSYGLDPQSTLLENSGNGVFRDVTADLLPEQGKLGMVSDACLLNQNGKLVLAVVGEWMPVKILTPSKDAWRSADLPDSRGWWNRVAAADLNADGEDDLILGNLGLNTSLRASVAEPIGLYVKDFDGNQKTDPILTWYRQGKEYVFVSTDDLVGQLPAIRKLFRDYSDFAELTFHEIFKPAALEGAVVKKVELLASCLALSDGTGGYRLSRLPVNAQFSPVFGILADDLTGDSRPDILLAGNLSGVRPDLGTYDASRGTLLEGDGSGGFRSGEKKRAAWQISGEVRDIKTIKTPKGSLVVIARNNAGMLVLKKQENQPVEN